ncbi:malonic semialdehyde reductase [Acidisoma cellulosilyticum]|nr:malonic semialdehyde reductase [Acidisoma cellulosilyticum]
MTDVTETNEKLTTEDAVPAHLPAAAAAPDHDMTLGEKLIAADIAIPEDETPAETVVAEPPAPKVFPYDLESAELARAFLHARTPSAWTDRQIDEETYRHLYDLVKLGPTSANTSPMRLVFVRSPEAKERLRTALTPANVEAVMTAPVTVIVAFDPSFYDFLTRLYPQADARPWFAWNDEFSQETAIRNSSLQGGYLIMAARLLGLDCWPMSGFDNARVDALFLDGRGWRSNFLLGLGYAETVATARNTRLMFEETCEVI